jgi:phosphoglycerate kinase
MKKRLRDLHDLAGKRVLIRVDFNVPQDAEGRITNDRRIRAALPTIQYVLDAGAAAIVMSHLGRPKGDPVKDAIYSMQPVAQRLCQLLKASGSLRGVCLSTNDYGSTADELRGGDVLVLENLRFHPGEQKGDPAFAAQLAALGDVYVNDAFGTCHRTDASMLAVPAAMKGKPRVVGFLVAKELEVLGKLLSNPQRPLLGVMGGAKVSDKMGFIKKMLSLVDQLLIGGAMTYTFLLAQGRSIGASKAEKDKVDLAKELLALGGNKIVLPVDHLVADKPEASAQTQVVTGDIPEGWFGMDIGPQTIAQYTAAIAQAGTVVWNGPLGKFEDEPFSHGTRAIAEAMAQASAVTIVGGGETAEAVEQFGLDAKMKHVSTGGGAFLEYVEGTPFKALDEIDDQ